MLNGGVYTQAQGNCMSGAVDDQPSNLPIPIPPANCIADICGDGIQVSPEQCDGSDFGGATCSSVGAFVGGTLKCGSCCRFDTSECLTCGNDARCQNHVETLSSGGSGAIAFSEIDNGSTRCPGSSTTITPSSVSCANVGTINVQMTVSDAFTSDSCTSSVQVVDSTNPTITSCPSPVTVNTDAGLCTSSAGFGPATASDACGISSVTASPGPAYAVGTRTITWTATDVNGNSAQCTHSHTVQDNERPSLTCPPNETYNTDNGQCHYSGAITQATFGDNCANPTLSHSPPGPYPLGDTTVVWTARDASGNTRTCSNVITVVDNQDPVFLYCPADVTVAMDPGMCSSTADTGTPLTDDNCPGESLTQSPPAPLPPFAATGPVTVTVTHTVTDSPTGNTATCTQQVTTRDDESPVIQMPADQTYTLNSGTHQTISYATPTCTDNCQCSIAHVSGPLSGDSLLPGHYDVVYRATDSTGHAQDGSFSIDINGVAIITPDPGSGDGTIYMYIPRPIVIVSHGTPQDTHIRFDFYHAGQPTIGYSEVTPVEATIVTVHGTVPQYYDMQATGMQSGTVTMGPTVRLCAGEWEGGGCVEDHASPSP